VSKGEGRVIASPSMSDDLKFKNPISCRVSAHSGSRKTSFCIRLLQNLDALRTEREFGGCIILCYFEKTAVLSCQKLPSKTTYHEGVPDKFGEEGCKSCLVILDNLLNDAYSKQVCNVFT